MSIKFRPRGKESVCLSFVDLFNSWCSILLISLLKNMLKRRKESGAYLATNGRHRWSLKMTMKNDN